MLQTLRQHWDEKYHLDFHTSHQNEYEDLKFLVDAPIITLLKDLPPKPKTTQHPCYTLNKLPNKWYLDVICTDICKNPNRPIISYHNHSVHWNSSWLKHFPRCTWQNILDTTFTESLDRGTWNLSRVLCHCIWHDSDMKNSKNFGYIPYRGFTTAQ